MFELMMVATSSGVMEEGDAWRARGSVCQLERLRELESACVCGVCRRVDSEWSA